jgi:hypothetical protein
MSIPGQRGGMDHEPDRKSRLGAGAGVASGSPAAWLVEGFQTYHGKPVCGVTAIVV